MRLVNEKFADVVSVKHEADELRRKDGLFSI